jgi:hypothetical protein
MLCALPWGARINPGVHEPGGVSKHTFSKSVRNLEKSWRYFSLMKKLRWEGV